MCDNNCDNLKPDRIRCESCRTINLARVKEQGKATGYYRCMTPKPFIPVQEHPVSPTCIRICSPDEYRSRYTCSKKPPLPYIGHGKLMYGVKAAVLAGSLYFTYTQGVWASQRQAVEAVDRWRAYTRSIFTKRPPAFDKCGRLKVDKSKESGSNVIQTLYSVYKIVVTSCFAGVIKFPAIIQCIYHKYVSDEMEQQEKEIMGNKTKTLLDLPEEPYL